MKLLRIIGGSLLIALAFNLFFLPYDIVPNGIYGIGALINYVTNYHPALFIGIINIFLLLLAYVILGKEKAKEYILPGILIPLFILLTGRIIGIIKFDNLEILLIVVAGSFITGLGYSLIYKEGNNVGGLDIFQDIYNSTVVYRYKIISYIVEGMIVVLTIFILSLESALYSLIVIVIIRYMTTKSKVGVSSSKTFFIITKEEEAVKSYIINELHHDLTEFNVKGGYSNNRNKILMTAIDTKDYYRLKEGILLIDPKAFISITDSYEVINKNVTLNKKQKKQS